MKIDEKAIKQAADMARLIVPDEEASALAQEFSQILKALDDINVNPAGENVQILHRVSWKRFAGRQAKPFHDAEVFQNYRKERTANSSTRVLDQE